MRTTYAKERIHDEDVMLDFENSGILIVSLTTMEYCGARTCHYNGCLARRLRTICVLLILSTTYLLVSLATQGTTNPLIHSIYTKYRGKLMIYTITFNPALDYIVRLDHLTTGTINRTEQEYVLGGGKGINVSIVLNNLGMNTTALGFIAGFTGDEIVRQLNNFGVRESFIRLKEGLTRINVK